MSTASTSVPDTTERMTAVRDYIAGFTDDQDEGHTS